MTDMIRAVWAYRYFILSSIRNELRTRFSRSKLGGLWMIVHPLAQVLIFALILSEVLAAKLPGVDNKYAYSLYLMAGSLCWALFVEAISRSLVLFVESGDLMKKMAFPRICLPVIAAGSSLLSNVLLLLAIFLVFATLGHFPDRHALWLPLLMVLTLSVGMGFGIVLGVMNVFMRDIGQVVPVILQALFWLTPIVYKVEMLPEHYQRWFKVNPIYPLVVSYQNVLVFGKQPLWGELLWLAVSAVVVGLLALILFRRASSEMVDVL